VSVLQHIVVPETQHLEPTGGEYVAANRVVIQALAGIVLTAVQLDDQADFQTDIVGEVRTDRVLATKSKSMQSTPAQVIPQPDLGVGQLLAQLSRESTLFIAEWHARSFARRREAGSVQKRRAYRVNGARTRG